MRGLGRNLDSLCRLMASKAGAKRADGDAPQATMITNIKSSFYCITPTPGRWGVASAEDASPVRRRAHQHPSVALHDDIGRSVGEQYIAIGAAVPIEINLDPLTTVRR